METNHQNSGQEIITETDPITVRKMLHRGILIGTVLIIAGSVWLFVEPQIVGQLFFIPYVMIITGTIVVLKGILKKWALSRTLRTTDVLDDTEDLKGL